jgi:hypothetical protein
VILLRLWPFWLQLGFSFDGWHIKREVGTVMAPTLFIGTERQKDMSVFVVLFLFFALSIGWKPK